MSASTALRLSGRDALTLLHRISTNAVGDLAPGQARATLFCDFRGRLLHRAVVYVGSDQALWLVRDDAPGAELAAYLDRHVFREDVRVTDLSASWTVSPAPVVQGMDPGVTTERDGVPAAIQLEGAAWRVRPASESSEPGPEERLEHEHARIEAGRAAHGHEISDQFTPFEVGLGHEVHLDKGCFTGQEALLRMITYRSARRHLARLEGRGQVAAPPTDVRRAGRPIGRLTSVAPVEAAEPGRWIGLAVLKFEEEAPENLEIDGADSVGRPHFFPTTPALGLPRPR